MRVAFDFALLSDRLLDCLIEDSRERCDVSVVGRALHDGLVSEKIRRSAAKAEIPNNPVSVELPLMSFEELAAMLEEVEAWELRLEAATALADDEAGLEMAQGLELLYATELAIAAQRDTLIMASEAALN